MDMNSKKIHFVGVGGVGMGTFAVALAENGYDVSGSDGVLYEPMKSVLSSAKIRLIEGFKAETATMHHPDGVVIGNVIRRDNPEAQAWLCSGMPFLSFPEAVRRYLIRDGKSVVIAGTHGKTTTTAWISFLMQELGVDPAYLVGGVPVDLPRGCALGTGDIFVGEGDEYDSAFFDKGAKFLHYSPSHLVLLNIEFDHADIYRDLDHVKSSFEKLVALLPGDGLLVANSDDAVVMDVVSHALCPVQTFGSKAGAMWKISGIREEESGFVFEVQYKGRNLGEFRTSLFGRHNLYNLLTGIVIAVNLGFSVEKVRAIIQGFHGVKRRQQVLMTSPVVLIDDFAHHPTEVRATLEAVRGRYPRGVLWAFFEPRSATSRRSVHQEGFAQSFDSADRILVAEPYSSASLKSADRFCPQTLVSALEKSGKWAKTFTSAQEMVKAFDSSFSHGDIVVVMSNGEFDKIQDKIASVVKKS